MAAQHISDELLESNEGVQALFEELDKLLNELVIEHIQKLKHILI